VNPVFTGGGAGLIRANRGDLRLLCLDTVAAGHYDQTSDIQSENAAGGVYPSGSGILAREQDGSSIGDKTDGKVLNRHFQVEREYRNKNGVGPSHTIIPPTRSKNTTTNLASPQVRFIIPNWKF